MSWLLNLFETYQSNLDRVGIIEKNHFGKEFTLLPISHTTQTAHIEVAVTEDGEFHSAFVIDKKDANTLIPCTEESSSRSTNIAPYPLHDKLSYVAGDFKAYGGNIKKEEPFSYYIKLLGDWAHSQQSHPKVVSIHQYLNKKRLIRDLVEVGILFLDTNNKLISTWDKKYEKLHGDKPLIFNAVTGGQESAFIRFTIYSPDKIIQKVWKDKEIYNSFIRYYESRVQDNDYCYVTGQVLPRTEKHANKIRSSGDMAKLISANDDKGFTYRGRFKESGEVANISYDVSQKAHNALKWLITRQGKIVDKTRVFLVWGNTKVNVPAIENDSFDLVFSFEEDSLEEKEIIKTHVHEEFAEQVVKAMNGYRNVLATEANINILVLDSATTGRLAVLYYRNMNKELYLSRLEDWHTTCVWKHRYRKDSDGKAITFFGAPATKDIAFAAYGPKANEKVVKGLMERMLPCIIDRQKIPFDIVRSAIQRASNPVALENWEWEKILSITCALINKEEGYDVALNNEINDRSYLFGRLLAIADVLERSALDSKETRATNAIRYMNSFSRHPERTWKTIQASLQPYQAKLGSRAIYLSKLIDEVASKFDIEDFNNKSLDGKYLLGFYSQRYDLYQKKEAKNDQETVNNEGGNK